MTRIDFHHGASDKVQAACRLIGQLHAEGRKVLVHAPAEDLAVQVDRMLWVQPATSFVPHCRAGDALAPETPVIIGNSLDEAAGHDVLVNLGGDLPPGFSRFDRLVEVVGTDEADRGPARERFRHYRDRGYAIAVHDLSKA
ncbi:MAG: DNA polymerase III subunit chi [Rhodocyclaceae bacterium]|nr:MAG: DNA polymerase III subunit chi [Rhodocyclaceae bacterium]MBE7422877.1 DNA polymerase III subunit chi [Zoogloeaceae bacterium]MBV6408414.1 DNA polymerase III subunit chi [Rhodocyclaceae bacterium]MCK6385289.1 DNA polymerase III subunit chi [Rhodocyclaceae bacterium]CAG0929730.1 DNA polymerase III subunit chi [Rhodocyclaceae bacterium]